MCVVLVPNIGLSTTILSTTQHFGTSCMSTVNVCGVLVTTTSVCEPGRQHKTEAAEKRTQYILDRITHTCARARARTRTHAQAHTHTQAHTGTHKSTHTFFHCKFDILLLVVVFMHVLCLIHAIYSL